MRRKALLIGITYAGTSAHLNGCVNDVVYMQTCLGPYGNSPLLIYNHDHITISVDSAGLNQPVHVQLRYEGQYFLTTVKDSMLSISGPMSSVIDSIESLTVVRKYCPSYLSGTCTG